MQYIQRIMLIGFFVVSVASAHLKDGSLTSPEAAKTYNAGSIVATKWTQEQYHAGKYYFQLSTDGGASFSLIDSMKSPSNEGVVTYNWTVPNTPTTKARFKVCQPGVPNACLTQDYFLTSGNFTIKSSPSALVPTRSLEAGMRILVGAHDMNVTFSLTRAERAAVEAFDAQGRSFALIYDEVKAPGKYDISLSNSKIKGGGKLLIELRLGNKPVAQTWVQIP